jgi:hypothetical protein
MTHCRVCGVLETVGESVVCEDCADKQKPCLYLHTVPGKSDVPAVRPYAYCYAYGISECQSGKWEISKECWGEKE